jgi:glycosyltransferase involved in cell wall biosynthesis
VARGDWVITPSIGVVVPTYARRPMLERVLDPLLTDPAASEVVVVVDGCDDGSMELLESMARRHPVLRPRWREHGGEGKARQTGLESLSTDIGLFVDDDVVASPGLVSGHLRRHRGLTQGLVLGYMPVVLKGPRGRGQAPTYLYAEEYERACQGFEADPWRILARFWAGNFSIRTADAVAVGMASEGFEGLYHADQDFGLRCAVAGMTGVFDRALLAMHLHQRSFDQFMRDGRAQGAGRVLQESRYRGLVEPVDEYLYANLHGTLRRLAKSNSGINALGALSRAAYLATGAMHAWEWEMRAARALRRCEQIRGARSARRDPLATAHGPTTPASLGD